MCKRTDEHRIGVVERGVCAAVTRFVLQVTRGVSREEASNELGIHR